MVSRDLEDEAPAVGPTVALWAAGERFEAGLTTAWLRNADVAAGDGSVTIDRIPFRLHAAAATRTRPWRAGIGAILGLDMLHVRSRDLPRTEARTGLAVRGGALAYVELRLSQRWYGRLGADALLLASGYDLEVEGGRIARQALLAFGGTLSLAYRVRP